MKARGRLLFGLVALASSFQIQDDCLVKEHIEDSDVMFDTLEFLSLVEENSPAVDVLLTCQNAGPIYLLSIGLEHFLLKKSGQEKPVQEESWDQLTKTAGWRRFKLGLANKTMTLECDSKPLLQKAFKLGCTVGGIKITKGRFTRKCSPGTPTWVVENDSELELPLVQMEKGVRESFTLFSLEPFTPSFSMKGAKVNLGFRGDSLVTSGDMKPLPAGPHDVSFQIFSEGNRTNLKVTKDGHIVQETALEDSPKCMEVSGDKKFVLVQKLGQTVPRNEHCNGPGEHCNGPGSIEKRLNVLWYFYIRRPMLADIQMEPDLQETKVRISIEKRTKCTSRITRHLNPNANAPRGIPSTFIKLFEQYRVKPAVNNELWCLAGVLAVVSTSFVAHLVFHYCYSRICKKDGSERQIVSTKNTEQKPSHRQSSIPEGTSCPAYLEPVSVPVAQFRGGAITSSRTLGRRSVMRVPCSIEHLYEEVDETRLTAIDRSLTAEHMESDWSSSGTAGSQ
ncbi:uncharacterized protein LOC125039337 [Penaeus chinensis]|uniref:uncharacterized protein LOC125039337 n=1 Tax=Penaeus chinensis TaxID=139456 RepID=UPI001FB7D816|nr:uncharacterized protein LOC125039337 [Penaeus chinensis]